MDELPGLSFHFGIRWEHIRSMPVYELAAYRGALRALTGDTEGL